MYGRFPQQINQLQHHAMMAHQQRLSQMQGGLGGLGGGLSDQVFEPLKNMLGQHLTQSVVQEKVEPFVEEVKQMAQDRFDLGGGTNSMGNVHGGRLGGATFERAFEPAMPMNQVQPFNSVGSPPVGTAGNNLVAFQQAFGGFADGGPVDKGLGSFLASNIDEFGRNGDTEVIHATKSEVVLPKGMVDNPQVAQTVRDLFEQTGRDMQEYTVGSGEMNVNPMTGYEEAFDLIGGIKDIFKKAAPVLLPIATSFLFPGMSPFLSGALAGGVGSLIQGGSIEDAFKAGITGGLTSAATTSLMKGSLSAGFKGDPTYTPGELRRFGEAAVNRPPVTLEGNLQQTLADPGPAVSSGYDKAKGLFMNPAQPGVSAAQASEQVLKIPGMTIDNPNYAELVKNATVATTPATVNTGRAIAGGLGALALAGGFDEIEEDFEDPYPYTSRELMEMNPERYRTGPIIAPRRRTLEDKIPDYMRYAAKGGEMEFPRRQGYIAGPGTETSDDIPAMLSDGEFVMTARAVRGAGDGSRKAGVNKMYDIMKAFEGGVVS